MSWILRNDLTTDGRVTVQAWHATEPSMINGRFKALNIIGLNLQPFIDTNKGTSFQLNYSLYFAEKWDLTPSFLKYIIFNIKNTVPIDFKVKRLDTMVSKYIAENYIHTNDNSLKAFFKMKTLVFRSQISLSYQLLLGST